MRGPRRADARGWRYVVLSCDYACASIRKMRMDLDVDQWQYALGHF